MKSKTENQPEIFDAISCETRRQILDLLVQGDQPVKQISEHFSISRPAISQHLRILLSVGLVTETQKGREHHYHLVPERLGPVRDWIKLYEQFWSDNFNRLKIHLMKRSQDAKKH